MNLVAEKRRETIMEMLADNGSVNVIELSKLFGISKVSIRNDLEALEGQGLLRRVHGGAVSVSRSYVNMCLEERMITNAADKKEISALAASLIDDNDTLMVNSGTTLTYFLRAIKDKKNISIVTNSIGNATEALKYSFNVVLVGGQLDRQYQFTFGKNAIDQIGEYHAAKCILSVDGVDADNGCSLYYAGEVDVINLMMANSNQTIVVADRSKIGRKTFTRVTDVSGIDTLVTNPNSSDELKKLEKLGVKVISH